MNKRWWELFIELCFSFLKKYYEKFKIYFLYYSENFDTFLENFWIVIQICALKFGQFLMEVSRLVNNKKRLKRGLRKIPRSRLLWWGYCFLLWLREWNDYFRRCKHLIRRFICWFLRQLLILKKNIKRFIDWFKDGFF